MSGYWQIKCTVCSKTYRRSTRDGAWAAWLAHSIEHPGVAWVQETWPEQSGLSLAQKWFIAGGVILTLVLVSIIMLNGAAFAAAIDFLTDRS